MKPAVPDNSKLLQFFAGGLLAATLLWYWQALWHYRLDAAQGDDFVDILWFFEIFLEQTSWQNCLDALLLANHEHITLLNHLLYWLQYSIIDEVNFYHYILIGHMIVLACCAILARWLATQTSILFASAIAVSCYLNLFYWDSSFWPMTAISNQAVIFFALMAAWMYQKNPDTIAAPVICGLLATASQFNGLCVILALLLAQLAECVQRRCWHNQRQILQLLCILLVVSLAYAWRENPFDVPSHLDRHVLYTEPDKIQEYHRIKIELPPFEALIKQLVNNVPATFPVVLGASIWSDDQVLLAITTGILLLVFFSYRACKNPEQIDHFSRVLFFFCLASIALIALGRTWFFGLEQALLSRYRMYAFLMLLLTAKLLLQQYPQRRTVFLLLLIGTLIQISSVRVLPAVTENRKDVADSYYYWLIDGGLGRSTMTAYPHNQDLRLFHAYERGYYNPYAAIATSRKPRQIVAGNAAICAEKTGGEIQLQQVQAWSKKARAIAAEITLDIAAPATSHGRVIFCDARASHEVTLDAGNVNTATGKYWPQIILKKDLPPAKYRVFWQAHGEHSPALLGEIVFP